MERAVVTVIGKDRVGIVANISAILAAHNVNILDISQTIMQDLFAMLMLVDISNSDVDLSQLRKELEAKAQELGLQVIVQHEDIFRYMHRI
ncbi:ACT domain-containing protein [bacterium]|nr:ACT domain-containing protein [bacterium]